MTVTPTQQRYLDFISQYISANGYSPSVREMCLAMGVASTNAVGDMLNILEKKGFIERTKMTARSIVLTPKALRSARMSPLEEAAGMAKAALVETAIISSRGFPLERHQRIIAAITALSRAGVR